MTADNRNVANSGEKSTTRTYFVSVDFARETLSPLSRMVFNRQCWRCKNRAELKPPQYLGIPIIPADPQNLIDAIAKHCSRQPGYIPVKIPLKDQVLRVLLANGNQPMTAEEVGIALGKWLKGARFPPDTSAPAMQKLLDSGVYWCVVSSDSGYALPPKPAEPTESDESDNRGGGNGRANDQSSEGNEEQQNGASAPITNGEDKQEETETGEIPGVLGTESGADQPRPQNNGDEIGEAGSGNDEGGIDAENDDSANAGVLSPFERLFFEALTPTPSNASDRFDILPEGGPNTGESAKTDTQKGSEEGRSGERVRKEVTRWQPTEAAQDLADKFREMVVSDYGSRCQVCGTTFQDVSGNLHTNVIHVVPPSADKRTNNLGNLMGLCGKHYDYIRYGEWAMLDPKTNEPFQSPEELREYFLNASPEIDDNGNMVVSVPVRFSNIYQEGSESPTSVDEKIRYSIPHWEYLCELFRRSDK